MDGKEIVFEAASVFHSFLMSSFLGQRGSQRVPSLVLEQMLAIDTLIDITTISFMHLYMLAHVHFVEAVIVTGVT